MTTTVRIENTMLADYNKVAKVVLKDEAGNVRKEAIIYPTQALNFNVWGGVKLEISEEDIPPRF